MTRVRLFHLDFGQHPFPKKLVRKRNIYKIVHFKGYYPPISYQTCPYFLRSTSDPIRRRIIGLVSDLYRRRVGGGTELDYVYCGNILDYRMLWMFLGAIFVRKSELAGFFHVNFYGFRNGKCGIFNMFTFSFLHSLSSCRLRMKNELVMPLRQPGMAIPVLISKCK